MKHAAHGAIALLVLGVVWPGSVAAQEYPLREGSLAVSQAGRATTRLARGEAIRIRGSGFEPGTLVTMTLQSEPTVLTRENADGAGGIDVTVRIPARTRAGRHEIEATGAAAGGGTLVLSRGIVVMKGAPRALDDTAQAQGAPRDDAGSSTMLVIVGVGAALALALMVVGVRRRLRRA